MAPRNIRLIDLNAVRENMKAIRASVPDGVKVLAVVKADAYGHGAAEVSRAAAEGGAEYLAVASVAEGVQLRKSGIDLPILVLGAVTREDAEAGVDFGLIQTVCSPQMVRICREHAAALHKTAEVHLKIDTGMGRIGVRTMQERDAVLQAVGEDGPVRLSGAFTHFADADGDESGEEYTRFQYRRFLELTEGMPEHLLYHCCNSAAIHRFPEMAMGMVRAGISLYGYPPVETPTRLKPCMRWAAKVSYVKELPPDSYVSYGRTWKAGETRRIATVTCGYADGYHRCAGGKAEVLIRGTRFPVVGRICMDQMMADVTGHPEIQPEDEVILIGEDGRESITAEDLARWSGTISYEILLSVGSRVERSFISDQQEVRT